MTYASCLAIRNGTIVVNIVGAPFVADVDIKSEQIVAFRRSWGCAAEEIDGAGKTITLGLLNIRTRYDGQIR